MNIFDKTNCSVNNDITGNNITIGNLINIDRINNSDRQSYCLFFKEPKCLNYGYSKRGSSRHNLALKNELTETLLIG